MWHMARGLCCYGEPPSQLGTFLRASPTGPSRCCVRPRAPFHRDQASHIRCSPAFDATGARLPLWTVPAPQGGVCPTVRGLGELQQQQQRHGDDGQGGDRQRAGHPGRAGARFTGLMWRAPTSAVPGAAAAGVPEPAGRRGRGLPRTRTDSPRSRVVVASACGRCTVVAVLVSSSSSGSSARARGGQRSPSVAGVARDPSWSCGPRLLGVRLAQRPAARSSSTAARRGRRRGRGPQDHADRGRHASGDLRRGPRRLAVGRLSTPAIRVVLRSSTSSASATRSPSSSVTRPRGGRSPAR